MKTLLTLAALPVFIYGTAFAQSSNLAHDAHRFVNNASAVSHINASTDKQKPDNISKISSTPMSEMNEHERAIIAHSFMNNSSSSAHQKMIAEHRKMLTGGEANSETSSFTELNAGDRAALVHESANNSGAEAHQKQARKLRELYESNIAER